MKDKPPAPRSEAERFLADLRRHAVCDPGAKWLLRLLEKGTRAASDDRVPAGRRRHRTKARSAE
jgi:hypothetical protein